MTSVTLANGPGGSTAVYDLELNPLQTLSSFFPFGPTFNGPVSMAVSATGEIAVAAGAGSPPQISVFDSAGNLLSTFFGENPAFTGGTDVAWLDPTHLAVGTGAGGTPVVQVFDTTTGQIVDSFFAFNPNYTGGITVAGIDADHVAVATNGGTNPTVEIFDLNGNALEAAFQPFGGTFPISISALADGEIAVGAGQGDVPLVEIFDASQHLVDTFFAFSPSFTGGVDVAWLDPTHLAVSTASGSSQVNVFDITDNEVTANATVFPNSAAGITLAEIDSTPCYCRGTLIMTAGGDVAVEALSIGDNVMTMAGVVRPIKWIGRRSYGGNFILARRDMLPICIKAGALAEGVPKRNLWVSPHHAMYLDGALIEAHALVNGRSIVQAEQVERVEYFHIELDSHDVIIADGALSETFIDDESRGMFHNADEYVALYPNAVGEPVRYCAPRLEDGYEVERVRQRIAQRAGLRSQDDAAARGGTLRGCIDLISSRRVAGWAQTAEHPEAPVCLDIFTGGQPIGQVLANRYREDLQRDDIGSGHHAFDFVPPQGISLADIEVRRSIDGAALSLSAGAQSLHAALQKSIGKRRAPLTSGRSKPASAG